MPARKSASARRHRQQQRRQQQNDSIQSGTCYAIARIIAVEVCAALDHSDYEVAALAARDAAYEVLAAADGDDYASYATVAKLVAVIARDKALEVTA